MARQRLLGALGPALGLGLLVLAVWILRHELRGYHINDVLGHLRSIPAGQLLAALGLTVLGYGILTGYDTLAFRYVGNPLAYRRIASLISGGVGGVLKK